MKKLWVFGDSFSAPFYNISQKYVKFKGYIPKVYCDVISEKLNIKGINCAKPGFDNYSILNSICDKVMNISDDDVIIIGWSSPVRFRIIIKEENYNGWLPILPGYDYKWANDYTNVFINRGDYSNFYWKEVLSWTKLINKKFNNKIIHFSPFADKQSPVPENWIIPTKNIQNIENETNGNVIDYHYSEDTHKFIAELFIERIENNLNNTDYLYLL